MKASGTSRSITHTQATGMLIATAIMWSLGGLLIKSIDLNPLAIAGTRSAIAALIILLFIRRPSLAWSRLQVATAISYSLVVILFVAANRLTTATNAIMLQYTAPIYVAFLAHYFLKERTTRYDWLIVSITIGGIALFFMEQIGPSGLLGNLLAILSGISFACFTILMRMQKDGSPLESVFLGNVFTAIIGLPFLVVNLPQSADWSPLLILGVVQLGIPYILYSLAIKHVSALDAILVPVLEPLLNPVWVFLWLGEAPGRWALLGALVVLSSVTVRYFLSRPNQGTPQTGSG
ncbi:MAG: EamA family transporter [Peptococcaceae bacterium]|nr:EamA family transporter [Peptococcaceae bacterium]